MIKEPNLKLEEVKVAYEQYEGRHLKIVQRDIALHEPTGAGGAWYARDVEAYIDALINEGWTLKDTHVVRHWEASDPTGARLDPVIEVVFILVR